MLFSSTKPLQLPLQLQSAGLFSIAASGFVCVSGSVWLCCKMLKGHAKYNCVLDFKKYKLGSAERKAREHVSAPGPWSMAVKCLPCFWGVTPLEVRPLWKCSHQYSLFQEEPICTGDNNILFFPRQTALVICSERRLSAEIYFVMWGLYRSRGAPSFFPVIWAVKPTYLHFKSSSYQTKVRKYLLNKAFINPSSSFTSKLLLLEKKTSSMKTF